MTFTIRHLTRNRRRLCRPLSAVLFVFMLVACATTGKREDVETALQQAGTNAGELIAVLDHYRGDSLRYEAACYLIGNMQGHGYSHCQGMDYVQSELRKLPRYLWPDSLDAVWNRALQLYPNDQPRRVDDLTSLSSEFLIANIDQAFRSWETSPWRREVNFKQFCQYILPYRVMDEPTAADIHWRDTLASRYAHLIQGITDMRAAFVSLSMAFDQQRDILIPLSTYLLDPLTTDYARFARCEQRCMVRANVMRALGLPVACDIVSYWANYSQHGHTWVVLVENDGDTYTVQEGDSVARVGNPIDASFFSSVAAIGSDYPYHLDSLKRAPKVYRRMFSHHPRDGSTIFDESLRYGLTGIATVDVRDADWVFLCTFRPGADWKVAAQARVRNKRGIFNHLGTEIVYLPAVDRNGQLVPVGPPFILHEEDDNEILVPDGGWQDMVLNRKYVLLTYWTNRWYEMRGGRFEGSNNPAFQPADVLHTINDLPVWHNQILLASPQAYRYVRYVSPGRSKAALAELQVFCQGQKLRGMPIGQGLDGDAMARVVDGDPESIGYPLSPNFWVGLDLGSPQFMDRIDYYPRNDGNFVQPGHEYELFYFDQGQWHSLGRQIATGDSLVYRQAPRHVLFHLHDRTAGVEERVFTYENGKQVWW